MHGSEVVRAGFGTDPPTSFEASSLVPVAPRQFRAAGGWIEAVERGVLTHERPPAADLTTKPGDEA